MRLLLLLLAVACTPTPYKKAAGDSGYAFHDTGLATDSGDSALDTGDTADSGDSGGPAVTSVDVFPTIMKVNPGAMWALRVVASDSTGWHGDVSTATFSSDDETIASVDASGVVTAIAVGATHIQVSFSGKGAAESVTVSDDLHADVTVIDRTTGLAIEGALVSLPGEQPAFANGLGIAHVPVQDGAPIMLTAWLDGEWSALTITATVQRELTMALTPKDAGGYDANLHGTVDFSGVRAPDADEMVVGFAVPSVQHSLVSLDIADLFADPRTVTIYGIDVSAPANLFVKDYAEDWYAVAMAGPVAAWGLAGPIPVEEATESFSGTGDALDLLVTHASDLEWDATSGLTAVSLNTTETSLAPDEKLSDVLTVALPALPLGFTGNEEWFVLSADKLATDGWVATGLGLGSSSTYVSRVPPGTLSGTVESSFFAFSQVEGLGSGKGSTAVVGTEGKAGVAFADALDVPTIDGWDPAARTISVTSDATANLVLIRVVDKKHHVHDLVAPASWTGIEPNCIDELARGQATVHVSTVVTNGNSFEDWARTGDWDLSTKDADAYARNLREP